MRSQHTRKGMWREALWLRQDMGGGGVRPTEGSGRKNAAGRSRVQGVTGRVWSSL